MRARGGAAAASLTFCTNSSRTASSSSVAKAVGFWTKSTAPACKASNTNSASCGEAVRIRIGTGLRAICLRGRSRDAVRDQFWHIQIAGDDVRFEFFDHLKSILAIPRHADHFDVRTAKGKHLAHGFSDERGIIDNDCSNETHGYIRT